MRLALQARTGITFSALHPITTWIVNHAADVINKFQMGKDGKTSYERVKGKSFKKELVEFGERVFYRSGKLDKQHKLEPRWKQGVYLGMCRRTGAAFIGDEKDVIRAHAIRRTPVEDRWKPELLKEVKGLPWLMRPSEEGSGNQGATTIIRPQEIIPQVETAPEEPIRPLRVRLKPSDFEAHGYTGGCPGCRALLRKGRPQSHSEECRARMEVILNQREGGRKRTHNAEERINHYIA